MSRGGEGLELRNGKKKGSATKLQRKTTAKQRITAKGGSIPQKISDLKENIDQ